MSSKTFLLLAVVIFLGCNNANTQKNKTKPKIISKASTLSPQIDLRIELLSIISRLAGYNEYNMPEAKEYVEKFTSIMMHSNLKISLIMPKALEIKKGWDMME